MSYINPTSKLSNKICQYLGAQQFIAIVMLHKVVSLIAHKTLLHRANAEKKTHAAKWDAVIVPAEQKLTQLQNKLSIYEKQLVMHADNAKEICQNRIDATKIEIDAQIGIVAQKKAEKAKAMITEVQKIELARADYIKDKEYLKVAFNRIVPIWGTIYSRSVLHRIEIALALSAAADSLKTNKVS